MFFKFSARLSVKFLLAFSKKNASLVADFSHIQGKYHIEFINCFNDSGILYFIKYFF
jgi:hypothetical protein